MEDETILDLYFASDTWLHTWNAIPPARPGCLRAFVGRITRNLSFTRWEAARAQKRGGGQTEILLSELADCLPGDERVDARLDAQAVTLTIEAYLRTQTRENRQLFVRRYYYGDSVRRLSGLFGLTETRSSPGCSACVRDCATRF